MIHGMVLYDIMNTDAQGGQICHHANLLKL